MAGTKFLTGAITSDASVKDANSVDLKGHIEQRGEKVRRGNGLRNLPTPSAPGALGRH